MLDVSIAFTLGILCLKFYIHYTIKKVEKNNCADNIHECIHKALDMAKQFSASKASEATASAYSEADELAKFKKLYDDRVITQEEFEAKKRQLLGL